ncbi:hypothetical protein DZ860_09835 [Vibrio sinensis]|uniref:Uncharacterized protein n=1 Tax=Vibrio sinensis TaxID=2302434 RepID=A0A3A6R4D8_9VIBR|nr:hypothetical protein DZ860_09835 [Vibrio sinensis]
MTLNQLNWLCVGVTLTWFIVT